MRITFEHGEIAAVNGEAFADKVKAIRRIEEIGSAYAIGRDCNVGDTIVGIKGRVGFEAAAPKLIIEAHRLLEKSTLSKWQQYWKDQVGNWYGMFLHESQYMEPVMPDIEAMLTSSQRHVNGTAILRLFPYGFQTEARCNTDGRRTTPKASSRSAPRRSACSTACTPTSSDKPQAAQPFRTDGRLTFNDNL